jgi:hypothetical protein
MESGEYEGGFDLASTSRIPSAPSGLEHRPQIATWGWALRRAALGLLVLVVIVTLGAWLLWASIDPDEASAADAPGAGAATSQQR